MWLLSSEATQMSQFLGGAETEKTEPLGGEELPSLSQLFPWEPEPKMMLANDVGE